MCIVIDFSVASDILRSLLALLERGLINILTYFFIVLLYFQVKSVGLFEYEIV